MGGFFPLHMPSPIPVPLPSPAPGTTVGKGREAGGPPDLDGLGPAEGAELHRRGHSTQSRIWVRRTRAATVALRASVSWSVNLQG